MLIRLAEQFGTRKREGIEIQLKLTREEMANLIGLTRETVSRRLSHFQAEGIINYIDNKRFYKKNGRSL